MASSLRRVSGWLGKVRIQGLLKVITRDDRFVVRVADTDDLTVMASDITEIVRERGFADNWPALRIEHTAVDVPSPIVLFLGLDHPVRRDIEGLRPGLVTSPPESRFWRWGPRVARLGWGLFIVAATVIAGISTGNVVEYLPFAAFALFIAFASWSRGRWY